MLCVNNFYNKYSILSVGILICVVWFFFFIISPPKEFPAATTIRIEKGQTIAGTATILKEHKIIRSTAIFNVGIVFYKEHVVEGDYFFEGPLNIFEVLTRITKGYYNLETRDITFFEGMTVEEMTDRLVTTFPDFDDERFRILAKPLEGYLFPDTYTFRVNVTPEIVIAEMQDNFQKKIALLQNEIENSPHSLNEIVIMASIVEKEATADSRQMVSDILWGRIATGLPLQVDAPFVYAIDKGTFDLSIDDLQTDNPYNTYRYPGLTPTPISNPGLESLRAAATPKPTEYIYFLTGRDGNMYYAKTFEGHKRNRLLYLD